jgi:hypothetical protein
MTAKYRPFIKATYLVGVLLIVSAVSDPIIRSWPIRIGELKWRFGAAGLFADALVGIIFGLVWLMAVAAILDNRRTMRAFSFLNLVFALLLCVLIAGFGLDFLQVRSSVNPQLRGSLDLTVLRALVTLALSIVTTAALGLSGWRSTREVRRTAAQESREGGMLYRPIQAKGGTSA